MKDRILDVIMAALYGMIILSTVYILALFGESNAALFMRSIGLM